MMAEPVQVGIHGLNEFRRRLRTADQELPRQLRIAMNDAAELVVDGSRRLMPAKSGQARKSVRKASTQTSARVRLGSNRAPYAAWLDFGGHVGRNGAVYRQFRKNGRYVYVTYFRLRDQGRFQDVLSGSLYALSQRAGIQMERSR